MAKAIALAEEGIISKIYLVRGQKVMIDRDLAELYGMETKRLKEAVRRNISRFPLDFLFEMSKEEFEDWRTQNATSKEDKQGLRYAPFCFTEQGVTMLSCVLNSERGIAVNILIIRVFTRIREMLLTHKDILPKLEQLENQVIQNSEHIQMIFAALKKLLNPPAESLPRVGFRRADEKDWLSWFRFSIKFIYSLYPYLKQDIVRYRFVTPSTDEKHEQISDFVDKKDGKYVPKGANKKYWFVNEFLLLRK